MISHKLIHSKKRYWFILLCFLHISCYKDLDKLSGKQVNMVANNQTNQNLDYFKILAYSSNNQIKISLDSVVINNVGKSSSKNIVFKNNKLGIIDGQFEIIAKFENGKNIKTDCCYFKNGSFLVSNLNFSINENEISVKSH